MSLLDDVKSLFESYFLLHTTGNRVFFIILCYEKENANMEKTKWSETVVLVDADYVDGVAFNLIVNFERMLNRPIPKADLSHWLVCVALDGGLKEGENDIQVVLVHGKEKKALENFVPSVFEAELDGKAFRDERLGEFKLSAVREEDVADAGNLFVQSFMALADEKDIKRLILVPDMEQHGVQIRDVAARTDGKEITLLAMEPQAGRGFRQEILGYSLMSAMGIRGEEFK